MFKVMGKDNNDREWCVGEGFATREEAVKHMVQVAKKAVDTVPNNATVDQTGPDEVSVLMGVYKVRTYRVVADTR